MLPRVYTLTPGQVGQVFGVAIDDASPPNIYLAATSVYGLSISVPDSNGQMKRVRRGQAGAQFVPGQFGPPELGGNPGSIWRVDGTTGEVSPFATVGTAGYGAASLGGLAYDPTTRQIFAVERSTGIVYRFGLDGAQRGTYDHGVEGRPGAGLPAIAQPPTAPIDITSPAFNSTSPTTWGLASPARRVFALAVHDNRLFYTVEQGPQVWSVGISPSGAVAASPRVEVEVPSLQDGVEITSITFDSQGRMYLAERGATTGDYFLYQLANGGESRVLRFVPKLPGDPSPGRWQPDAEQYSIGMAPNYTNANGGVALGYGYVPGSGGIMNPNACGGTVWSTGERLLDPGDPAAAPGSFPFIDGLQGNSINLVQPQNIPPAASWFIDFDDKAGHPDFRGYMGAVATLPCAAQPVQPPVVTCPPGTYYNGSQCIIIPTCPSGTTYQNGQCVYPTCPPGYYLQNGQCVPPPVSCPPGTFYYQGQCYPISCPPGLVKQPNGQCTCPPGDVFFNGKCVPPQACPPGMITLPGGICWCPLGMIFGNGVCNPPQACPPGQVLNIQGQCVPVGCPPNQENFNGQCVPKCPPGQVHKMPNGVCGPPIVLCLPPNELFNGKCVPKCPPLQVHQMPNGACGPPMIFCLPPNELFNGKCVPKCPPFQQHTPPNGVCKPVIPPVLCLPPKEMWNGQCVNQCPPGQVHKLPNGACAPIFQPPVLCLPPKEMWNGQCVNQCPPFQFHTPPNGQCKPLGVLCPAPKELWNGQCLNQCPPGQVHQPPNGACSPILILCLPPQELWNGQCVNKCPPGQVHTPPNGQCKLQIVVCQPPKELWNGQCVNQCPPGLVHTPPNGQCKPLFVPCLPPKEIWNGQCVNQCPPLQQHTPPNGQCKPIFQPPVVCLPPKEMWNGQCVNQCPPLQQHTPPNGQCKPLIIQPQIACSAAQGDVERQVRQQVPCRSAAHATQRAVQAAHHSASPAGAAVVLCAPPKEMWNGQCVDKCAAGQVHTPPNGQCKAVGSRNAARAEGDVERQCVRQVSKWPIMSTRCRTESAVRRQ